MVKNPFANEGDIRDVGSVPGSTPVTPSCDLTVSQSEGCAQADHRPWDSLPSPGFKSTLVKPFAELEAFQGTSDLFPCRVLQ